MKIEVVSLLKALDKGIEDAQQRQEKTKDEKNNIYYAGMIDGYKHLKESIYKCL